MGFDHCDNSLRPGFRMQNGLQVVRVVEGQGCHRWVDSGLWTALLVFQCLSERFFERVVVPEVAAVAGALLDRLMELRKIEVRAEERLELRFDHL